MNLRFHPGILELKKLISDGDLGTIHFVQASFGYDLRLWRPESGADTLLLPEASRHVLGGSAEIQGAAFSPDGSVLALSTAERVELWSAPSTGQAALLAVVRGHFDGTGIGRGRPILAAGDGAYVNLWDLDRTITTLRDPVPEACRLGGGLTPAEWPRYVKDLGYTAAC